jgi:TamB, inner membrane protein subunit of TAM complex
VGEEGQASAQARRRFWRRMAPAVAAAALLLLVSVHRPFLRTVLRIVAQHYAAGEHLKVDFRLEGSVLSGLLFRNVHITPTGPSAIESLDVDLARADYSLFAMLFHGPAEFLRNIDVQSARLVLNPAAAPVRPRPPERHARITLPSIFPDRARFMDISVLVRGKPHDVAFEHVDLELDPRAPGTLRIGRVQLAGGQQWTNVSAQTSYADKNLIIRNLILDEHDQLRLVNVDASKIHSKTLTASIEAALGGPFSASLWLQETGSSLNTRLQLTAERVPAQTLNKYLALPEGYLGGEIERLNVDLHGILSRPESWNGSASAQLSNFRHPQIALDRALFMLSAQNGHATLSQAQLVQGANEFHLRGSAELPRELKQIGRSPMTLELSAAAVDLARLTANMPQRLTGSAQINGKIDISAGKMNANFSAMGGSIAFPDGTLEKFTGTFAATKSLAAANTNAPWFADLQSAIQFQVSNVRYRDYRFDAVTGSLSSAGDLLRIQQVNVSRNNNSVTVFGWYQLPGTFARAGSQDLQLNCELNAPQLGDYWDADSADRISGPLEISAQIQRKNGVASGLITLYGAGVTLRDAVFKQLTGQCSIWNNIVYLNDFSARLNEQDFVGANGFFDLTTSHRYGGKISANVADLSVLEPVLRASGNERALAGSLALNWQGEGEMKPIKHSGKLKLLLDHGRYGNLQSLEANADATYSPEGLDVPVIFFGSDKMDFQAVARTNGDTLEISKIQLDQGSAHYAQGYISIPFIWKNLGTSAPVAPANGRVLVNFESQNVEIAKLFTDVGAKPPASGTVSLKLDAQGTLADLSARLDVQMRDLRTERLPSLEPASFDLLAQSQRGQLAIAGKLQQAKIQPLELTANLPLDLTRTLRERRLADETPITAKVRLPRSSVNFVRQLVPAVQELDGDAGLDVDVAGTIGRPVFSGSGDITINVARASNVTLPALRDFKARLNFARDTLSLEQFGGELSGGRFRMNGRVTFPKLTAANLDLQLRADSALLARNDTVTARADADIKITGPLESANVTGTVAMTNSHVLKNLDLVPIGLPGRPAPQPPSARPEFSFADPPLRDWKFDVAIKTKDPVLIRGSLANGGAVSDMHVGGTGLHPQLQGMVRLENLEATLPFSRLEIASGFVYFDPSDSFNPRLELHGTSVIRDYTIHVYIYGTALAPEAIFTSEPPLAQEEIISLLATGTTREELTASNNVLAGRAAMLLVQQLYRKIFKKGEPTQTNSIFDRLDVDVGTVDPRTGRQQATARFKVNDQFIIVGDIGVGGDYRGMVKYLIRFR